MPFDNTIPVICNGISPVLRVLPCVVNLSTITIKLDQFIGEQNVTIDIKGGFTNPSNNRTVNGFEMRIFDANNF